MPKIFAEVALEQAPGAEDFYVTSVPEAFAKLPESREKDEFLRANEECVTAMKAYTKFLKEEVLPHAKGDFALGPETFAAKLKFAR